MWDGLPANSLAVAMRAGTNTVSTELDLSEPLSSLSPRVLALLEVMVMRHGSPPTAGI
jgi:hypothetical protein